MPIDRTPFRVYRGKESSIRAIPVTEGYLYIAIDSGRIYTDYHGDRKLISNASGGGGGNTGLHYANYPEVEPDEVTELFTILRDRLEDPEATVMINDLIINSDGAFFRVINYDGDDLVCSRIAVSGGGGGSSAADTLDLSLTYTNIDKIGATYIYQQSNAITFYPAAEKDEEVSMVVTVHDNTGENEDIVQQFRVLNNDPCVLDAGTLPLSNNFTITVLVNSTSSRYNYGRGWTQVFEPIRVVEMGIRKISDTSYQPIITSESLTGLSLSYVPVGNANLTQEQLNVYIDNAEVTSLRRNIAPAQYGRAQSIAIPSQSHGSHTIELSVSTTINSQRYESDRISFQAAWAESGNELPIVWIGNYDETVVQYTNASIPFMIYNPVDVANSRATKVTFYLNGEQVSELDLEYSNVDWHYWDITDLYQLGANMFNISIAGAAKAAEAVIEVTDVGARDLSIKYAKDNPQAILLNLSSAGRSSNELKSVRNVWRNTGSRTEIQPVLYDFNWANNGWVSPTPNTADYKYGSYLSLANGSSVSIPMPNVSLNNGTSDYTFEFRLRVRNIQKYSTLVTQIPTYFYEQFDPETNQWVRHVETPGDSKTMDEIEANENLRVAIDEYGSPWSDEDHVIQSVNTTNGVILSWLNNSGHGIVIGTQEAFFQTPQKLVNVRYKEDEVFNLSFVISATEHLAYIYLNGIASGATPLAMDGSKRPIPFVIEGQNIIINSNYADVDIYRIRMYGLGLTIPDVIHNYLADMHDLALYDQNQLFEAGEDTELSYSRLIEYNNENPDNPTMPYAIWKITALDSERRETLPYFKGDSRKVDITFVNPSLDRALDAGEISEWYYYTHSPSFEAKGVDINVQGTSSQGYPRRNYKTKYKKATEWVFTHGPLAGQSVAKDHYFNADGTYIGVEAEEAGGTGPKKLGKKFHMDAEKYSTDKFTWKIDYMESSGTYNTGFANLMGNVTSPLYNKHPLNDYGFNVNSEMRTTVYGYPVLVFHQYADSSQMVYSNGEQRGDGEYEYIGRYNMNLDKSSNEFYGFELSDPHPFVPGKTVADVSECWEMKDNWGTWCSLRFPDSETREVGFGSIEDNKLDMVTHYEVRYNKMANQMEAILGEKLDYNGKVEDQTKYVADIGEGRAAHNHFLRQRFFNLEKLLYWTDSTDLTTATNGPIVIATPVKDNETGEITISKTYPSSVTYPTLINYNINQEDIPTYYYIDDNGDTHEDFNDGLTLDEITELGYTVLKDENDNPILNPNVVKKTIGESDIENGCTSVRSSSGGFNTTFTKDTRSYRYEKFRREFSEHFDMHYCLVYFVMTELCLCFDSRGKNMMLASYGPQSVGGDYIWYPIFYDIDTQLGLNNSGSYLWDYDADVTPDGIFSTATSVLWNNLYEIFYTEITQMYQNLRGGKYDEVTNRQGGKLNYPNIVGAYECDPTVYDSYAMRGVRPIIALGLDEYYKYFATTTTSGIGFFDTNGIKQYENTPTYAYCCQGDKKLTTELLLRNRLNYLDSQWLAGSYTSESIVIGGIEMRMTLNNVNQTSDNYLDLTTEQIANSGLTGYVHGDYPVPYFDARPGVKIRPFLKQYVTYFMDTIPMTPKKFNDTLEEQEGIWTNVLSNVLTSYREKTGLKDQIVKVPGADYISSLNDLSTSYITRMNFSGGKRLLDFKLGSDVPGYRNAAFDVTQFNFHGAADDSNHKPLLKQIILSQMSTFNKDINLSGSAKLEECRALGSNVSEIVFAPGAPLKIVHLPSSVISLELVEATELKNILTTKPIVGDWDSNAWTYTYRNPDTYSGLYIENVTDNVVAGAGHKLERLSVNGSGLGYGLYTILDNLITIKLGALSDNTLYVNLKQIDWTPYHVVSYGETQGVGPYYRLNDHSMFELYEGNDATEWNELTLNGLIYTKDLNYDESTIQSLELLDKFIADYTSATTGLNKFRNTSGSVNRTYPALAGEMYVSNADGDAINESDLTNLYGVYWPDLTIRVAKVNPAYIAKYVQVLDSGKVEEIDVIRYANQPNTQVTLSSKVPQRQYYDFLGWALTRNPASDADWFIKYNPETHTWGDILNVQTFSAQNDVITLYAIFEQHRYKVTFKNPDGSVVALTTSTYGTPVLDPGIIPSTSDNQLPVDETYRFKGYSRDMVELNATDRVIQSSLIQLDHVFVTHDMDLWCMYKRQSVYAEPADASYFEIDTNTHMDLEDPDPTYRVTNGVFIKPIHNNIFNGKVTFPNTFNGRPVIGVTGIGQSGSAGDTYGNHPGITHVFFEDHGSNYRYFMGFSFANLKNLVYIEWPETTRRIMAQAFYGCYNLILGSNFNNMHLLQMGENAFNQAVGHIEEGFDTLEFRGCFNSIGLRSMGYMRVGNSDFPEENARWNQMTIQFGGPDDPSTFTWETLSSGHQIAFLQNSAQVKKIIIYASGSLHEELNAIYSDGYAGVERVVNRPVAEGAEGIFTQFDGTNRVEAEAPLA